MLLVRAAQLRNARTCYDHLVGRLGVRVTQALIDTGALAASDGITDTRRRPGDRLSSHLPSIPTRSVPTPRKFSLASASPPTG